MRRLLTRVYFGAATFWIGLNLSACAPATAEDAEALAAIGWSGAISFGIVGSFFALARVRRWVVERGPCLHRRPVALSKVPDHEGPCAATWINPSGLNARLDGGRTGFFRRVRRVWRVWISYGPEFHGIAPFGTDGTTIFTTATGDPYEDDA